MMKHRTPILALLALLALVAVPAALAAAAPPPSPAGVAAPILPPDKQARVDAGNRQAAAAAANMAPNAKANDPGRPKAGASALAAAAAANGDGYLDPHFAVGDGMVIQNHDGPPGDTTIAVANMWVRQGPWLFVYAGSAAGDPATGLIVVRDRKSEVARARVAGHGALVITGGSASTLAITAADGTALTLDLATYTLR